MKNQYITLCMVIFATCMGVSIARYYESNECESTSLNTEPLQKKIAFFESENHRLQLEINNINQQLLGLRAQKNSLPSLDNNSHHLNVVDVSSLGVSSISAYQLTQRAEDFQRWLLDSYNQKPEFNLATEMQLRFEAEDVVPAWSQQQEQLLRSQFSNNSELAGAALTDVQCRSTQCQITIAVTDLAQANSWVNQTAKALNLAAGQKMIIATPNLAKNITALYIDMGSGGFNFQ